MVVWKICKLQLLPILAEIRNMSDRILFSRLLEGLPVFMKVGERSKRGLLSKVSQIIENLVIFGLLITPRNVTFFLISSRVSLFSFNCRSFESNLIRLLILLRLLELQHLIYPRFQTGFGMLGFFTNTGLIQFQVRYFSLICSFLSN